VDLKFTAKGKHTMTVNANFYNASTYHRKFYVFAGEDEFSKYEERLNDLIAKVRKYMDITVDTNSLRNRYYSGDKSALNDLKSMIRVEALTLTAAVMMDHYAENLASTAVDVISFKTLLNMLMEKMKESATYKEIVETMIEKINTLIGRITTKLKIDESLIDEISDAVAEKAGESLDSTISHYRETVKDRIKSMFFGPLKDAHDSMINQHLSKEEEARRRMLIYQYAEDGVGTENLFSGISEISQSIDEASSIVGGFLGGAPSYKAAVEIIGKSASILAVTADGLNNYNSYKVISDIVDAYEGNERGTRGVDEDNSGIIVRIEMSGNESLLSKIKSMESLNYTEPALVIEQIKALTYSYMVLEHGGNKAMLSASSERYAVWVKESAEMEGKKMLNISIPDTVIANKSFNISIESSFSTTLFAGNQSKYGKSALFTLSLPPGTHRIKVGAGDYYRFFNISSIDPSAVSWRKLGSVVCADTPEGLVAIDPKDFGASPEQIINESHENGGNTEGGNNSNGNENGSAGNGTSTGTSENSAFSGILEKYYLPILMVASIAVIAAAYIFLRKRSKEPVEKSEDSEEEPPTNL